jgi:hypothetical protein
MVLAIPLAPRTDKRLVHSEVETGDCPPALPEDPLEELLTMRYQEYLALRGLQELFESGALQSLES